MPETIRVRNVPDDLHREATARAAQAGISLSAYVLRILERSLEVPPIDEVPPVEQVLARLRSREPVESSQSSAEIIREIRGPL